MAVSNVYLQGETGSQDPEFQFNYVREYKVTHLASDATKTILTDPQLPQMWSVHPEDPVA